MGEITNHAWAILFMYLVERGDNVCEIASLLNSTPQQTSIEMTTQGLDAFTADHGRYSMRVEFADLLRLGYSVVEGMLLFPYFPVLPGHVGGTTALGANVAAACYVDYRNDANSTPQNHRALIRLASYRQAFLIKSTSMATDMLVHYQMQMDRIFQKCIHHLVNSLDLDDAVSGRISKYYENNPQNPIS
jgi:hypothetical protein